MPAGVPASTIIVRESSAVGELKLEAGTAGGPAKPRLSGFCTKVAWSEAVVVSVSFPKTPAGVQPELLESGDEFAVILKSPVGAFEDSKIRSKPVMLAGTLPVIWRLRVSLTQFGPGHAPLPGVTLEKEAVLQLQLGAARPEVTIPARLSRAMNVVLFII